MKRTRHRRLIITLSLAAVAVLGLTFTIIKLHNDNKFYLADPDDEETVNWPENLPSTPAQVTSATGCDTALWRHVHHPSRLKIYDNCLTIKGTITDIYHIDDGDTHILVRPDLGYLQYMNIRNFLDTHGGLVVEAICTSAPTNGTTHKVCDNFRTHLTIPPVGTHVAVTGSFVRDMGHHWNEIHPLSRIIKD